MTTELAQHTYDANVVAQQGHAMARSGPGDDQKFVEFDYHASLNRARSKQEGRPVYDNLIWVKIITPGEAQNQVIHRPSNDSDKLRWPSQWQAFQQGRQQVADGTPLELLFPAEPNIVKTLRHYNIITVEQLANLSAHGQGAVGMGAMQYVNKAKQYVAQAEKGVNYHAFNTEMEIKDQKIEALKVQVAEMAAQMQMMLQSQQQFTQQAQLNVQRPQPFQTPQQWQNEQMPSPSFDAQADMIANTLTQQAITQAPVNMSSDFMAMPDLGAQVTLTEPKKRGRPAGSKNKPKEN